MCKILVFYVEAYCQVENKTYHKMCVVSKSMFILFSWDHAGHFTLQCTSIISSNHNHSTRLKILNTFLRLNKIRQVQGGFKCDAQLFFKTQKVFYAGKTTSHIGRIEIYFWVEDIFQFDQLEKKTATQEPKETFIGFNIKYSS